MPLSTRLLHLAGQLSRRRAAQEFEDAAQQPERVQGEYLRMLLQRNADTAYGRAHGFASIRSAKEFATQVPIQDPLDVQPWVRRQMGGERNVLTASPPAYYVKTSGSTAAPKYVPITEDYRVEFQKTVQVSLWHLYRRFPQAFTGRALYFVGSRRVERAGDGCDVGTMSGYNFTELPRLVRALYAWPYELFEVKDGPTRSTLALLLATAENPTLIAGVFPAPIVYMLRDLAARAEELAGYLARGRLPEGAQLTAEQRAFFEARLGRPHPGAAARLKAAARAPEEQRVGLAWPALRLVYCWTSSTAALFVPELQRRLGPRVAVRDAIYSACEGWNSIPLGDPEPGGVLAITSHYFEFVPEAEVERRDAHVRTAAELEIGGRYYILMTTGSGMYRYFLGDVVEVYGRYGATPRIRFVRKGGAASNLLGEKLDEAHVNHAMGLALGAAGVECTFFTLAPAEPGLKPGYALYLEPSSPSEAARAQEIAARCDEELARAGYDYDRLRKGGQLLPVAVVVLPSGTYDRIRTRRMADGSAEAQLKTAHLVGSRADLPPELLEAEAAQRVKARS